MHAEQLQVDEQQIHFRIADALANAQRGAMHAVYALLDCGQCVREAETTVAVPVPVELHGLAGTGNDFSTQEPDELPHALRRGVPDRIRETDAARAALDRERVERAQRLGPCPRRI